LLNPPNERLRFLSCVLEESVTPPPLSLPEYRLYRVHRRKKIESFSACRRGEGSSVHFDVRWFDGPLRFTGKLEMLPQHSPQVQELAMYDDYINYYGFPRELGFIRAKRLLQQEWQGDQLIEVIIPRVSPDGCAAQFRVNAVPGQSMLSMYKQKRAREHMFVLRGRMSMLDDRALVELRHRDVRGNLLVAFQARRIHTKEGQSWRVGFTHPLSAFQTFCILLALNTGSMNEEGRARDQEAGASRAR